MIFAIALVAYRLPARSLSDEPIQSKDGPSRLRRIDFVGAFLLTITITAFLGALSLGGQALPWSHALVICLLAGSIVIGAIFVIYGMHYVPLYFRVTQGSRNTSAGLHLVPAVFGNTLGGLLAGWLIARFVPRLLISASILS